MRSLDYVLEISVEAEGKLVMRSVPIIVFDSSKLTASREKGPFDHFPICAELSIGAIRTD